MMTSFAIAAFVILSAVALLAMLTLLRGFLASIRQRREPAYVPIPDPSPPAPVLRDNAAILVGTGALLWAALHVLVVAMWGSSRELEDLVPVNAQSVLWACYVLAGGVILAAGAILMLCRKPLGRRIIAWGEFLFGVMSFMMVLVALLLPAQEEAPVRLREAASWLLILAGVHVVIDTVIGSLAQNVGKPANIVGLEVKPAV